MGEQGSRVDNERALFAALAPFLTGRLHDAVRAHRGDITDPAGCAIVALQGLIIRRVRSVRADLAEGRSVEAELNLLIEIAQNWTSHPEYPGAAIARATNRWYLASRPRLRDQTPATGRNAV